MYLYFLVFIFPMISIISFIITSNKVKKNKGEKWPIVYWTGYAPAILWLLIYIYGLLEMDVSDGTARTAYGWNFLVFIVPPLFSLIMYIILVHLRNIYFLHQRRKQMTGDLDQIRKLYSLVIFAWIGSYLFRPLSNLFINYQDPYNVDMGGSIVFSISLLLAIVTHFLKKAIG